MTGWAATNTLREALPKPAQRVRVEPDIEYVYGSKPWLADSVDAAHAALALVETALDAAEPMANLPWPLSADERQEWIVAQNRLRAALRAVREGAS